MGTKIKKVKQICECKNCGNEAEMTFTCKLEDVVEAASDSTDTVKLTEPKPHKKVKGTGICSHCGNEADMWIDL